MPNFRHRLTRAQQREYDRSNAIASIPLRVSPRLARAVVLLEWALTHDDRPRTARVAQVICDELCAAVAVSGLRVGPLCWAESELGKARSYWQSAPLRKKPAKLPSGKWAKGGLFRQQRPLRG